MVRINQRLIRVVFAAVALFVLATLVLCLAGLRDDIGKADIALVLGSKVELSGKPSLRLQARLDKTVELYKAGWFPWVIVSGGLGKEGFDEAAVMRDYLAAHGVPSAHILLDSEGNTTFDSAQNTLQLLRQKQLKSVLVISQYFHIPRSRLALERTGIEEIHSASPSYFELRDLYSAPRELIGYFSYAMRSFDKQ
ncbi:YdcF family protein [Prosthecobacter sp.]|uniref:YdcF family protein n=1 Tax=Prosthecobacter sp. TaxID=1965333 RepID=UPI00378405DB